MIYLLPWLLLPTAVFVVIFWIMYRLMTPKDRKCPLCGMIDGHIASCPKWKGRR